MTSMRRLAVLLVSAAAVLLGQAPAYADAWATVGNTGGMGLTLRAGPSPSTTALAVLPSGTGVSISCQAYGATVANEAGFTSNLWDYVPARGGYLADAYMATGYDYRIPGVPECGTTGGLVPIQQNQGQLTQWEDCGPTAVVTSLLRIGRTPHEWNPSYPRAAIERARQDMGLARGVLTGGTNESHVVRAFSSYGLSAWTSWSFEASLTHVRSGRPAVMAGNTRALTWATNVRDPAAGVAHFLTVAGYDSA